VSASKRAARRVLIVGAQGFLGGFLARAFAERGWNVTRAGRRPEPAADFRLVDVDRPDTVRAACRDVDLVVSTVRTAALGAERVVLHDGPILMHLDDLPAPERSRLRSEVAAPRGLVVDRAGLYGVAMLALVELLDRHPEADAVDYGFMASLAERAGPAGGALVHRMLSARARRPTAVVALPEPFGRCRTIEAGPDAASLFPAAVGERRARVHVSFLPKAAQTAVMLLNAVGLASRLPLAAFTTGRGRPPAEPTRQPTAHWVNVRRRGVVVESRVVRGAGDYRMSTAATLAFADALLAVADRPRPPAGIVGVDELFRLADLAPALAAGGITVEPRSV
jgi:NAD(P)-dependent dehydrogenase (short-subunit alcohol dehydrogenase family)